jgi:hypothetical protein
MRRSACAAFVIVFCSACGPSDPGDGTATGTTTTGDSTGGASTGTTGDETPTTGDETTALPTTGTSGSGTDGETTGTTGEPACDPAALTKVSRDELLLTMRDDLVARLPDERPFTRYLVLAHLRNAGLCDDEVLVHRAATGKLLNSLSDQPVVVVPEAIGTDGLVLRIDLRDYGWETPISGPGGMFPDTWAMLVANTPYAVEPIGEAADVVKAETGVAVPYLSTDAALAVLTLPPMYYDVLELPGTRDALAAELNIDIAANIEAERMVDAGDVARAGFHESSISENHRIAERHVFPDAATRALWLTHDFSSNAGDANFFFDPFAFEPDAGAVMFTLRNGLYAYMYVDAAGNRVDEAPLEIVQDLSMTDGIVRPGISCIGCHARGPIAVDDDLRWEIDSGRTDENFDDNQKLEIRNLFPPREEFAEMLDLDVGFVTLALGAAGVPEELEVEPISTAFQAFHADVDLGRAAAELWVTADELAANLGKLDPVLADLQGPGLSRADFTDQFAVAVCALKVGLTDACP